MAATPIPFAMAESIEAGHANGADAASKLAADVNAAAEALDNLKSLLRRQFPDVVLAGLDRAPETHLEAARAPENRPLLSASTMSAHAPTHAPVASLVPAGTARSAEPRRLDLPGFLAGFALSAAIGAVLYYFAAG